MGYCRYVFEACEPGAYMVRLEMHEPDDAYIAFLQETGAEYVGRMLQWIYLRRRTSEGPFDLFSDIDSRIAHLNRIGMTLTVIGILNLGIGVMNALSANGIGVVNLLVATLLMYGLGRIHGKKEALERERELRE